VDVAIIGGGTTGWLAAKYLEKKLPNTTNITLYEDPDTPVIGVGESTLPQIKTFLEECGLNEKDWMPKTNAIIKKGSLKKNWDKINGEECEFAFWHNDKYKFETWVEKYFKDKKTKNQITNDLYDPDAWRPYAYHVDANLIGKAVKDECKKIKHELTRLDKLPPGYDLYLDATGFNSKFTIDKTLTNKEDHLVNSCWAGSSQLHGNPFPFTRATARNAGWTFGIDLANRTGLGYVYSNKYITKEEALTEFKSYYPDAYDIRHYSWIPGYLKNPWTDNVISIGNAVGFLDALEANTLLLIQLSITKIPDILLRNYKPKTYNRLLNQLWSHVSNYILHHYKLSNRTDTPFWKYYSKFNVKESVWQAYQFNSNKYSSIFPNSVWANLALYYDEFTYYDKYKHSLG
tara:strand:+ start:485 stop:1690 length:1206 start_codon:yes stop_codon:yes gene_type:complete